jgi:hypothetical protein
MRTETSRSVRKDGTRGRVYVCQAHRNHHSDSAEWCPARPVDATIADRIVLDGIDGLLGDADTLRERLSAGRTAETERMGKVAGSARAEAAKADRVAEKAQRRYERALAEDDDEAAEIALAAVRRKRTEAAAARTRLDAALDAMSAEPEREHADVLERVWEALSGRIEDAHGDVRKLNAALREMFEVLRLEHVEVGLRITPVLSADAILRVARQDDRWREKPTADEFRGMVEVCAGVQPPHPLTGNRKSVPSARSRRGG